MAHLSTLRGVHRNVLEGFFISSNASVADNFCGACPNPFNILFQTHMSHFFYRSPWACSIFSLTKVSLRTLMKQISKDHANLNDITCGEFLSVLSVSAIPCLLVDLEISVT